MGRLGYLIVISALVPRLGAQVNAFVPEHHEAFIYGMRVVFLSAAALCVAAIGLTLARALTRERA